MQNRAPKSLPFRTGGKSGIWLALAIALGLHLIILSLPATRQDPVTEASRPRIELQLTTPVPQPPAPKPGEQPVQVPVQKPEPVPEPVERMVDAKPEVIAPPPPLIIPGHEASQPEELKMERLSSSILARQFITVESEADRLFGKPLELSGSEPRKEFHFPLRQDMVSMLDQPMPELPFAYTPGLVRFAYEPGIKGELQRIWDVITPEFGWTTDNGTEFRCIWVLVIGGCGWK